MRGMESLVCTVFIGLSIKEEADMFSEQNEGTKKLTPYDTFKANFCRGEATDTAIKRVCDSYGIQVEKSSKAKTLKSVTAAREVVKNYGSKVLAGTFEVFRKCGWDDFKDTYRADIVRVITEVRMDYANNVNLIDEKLVDYFEDKTPADIVSSANVKYSHYGRQTRLKKYVNDIVADPSGKVSSIRKIS